MALKLAVVLCSALLAVAVSGMPAPDNNRVIGGTSVTITEFPYQVSVERIKYGTVFGHACGGAILNERWILTAAHCVVKNPDPRVYRVRISTSYYQKEGELINVEKLEYHSKYDHATTDYDVALLKLARPIVFSTAAKPVSIIGEGVEAKQGSFVDITGWGTTRAGVNAPPQQLQHVRVPVVARNICAKSYNRYGTVTDRMFCAAGPGMDACQGDSGGPVVNTDRLLVGIVSWGYGCALPGFPGIYTDVSHPEVNKFITNAIKN